jgi:hypothetical protein
MASARPQVLLLGPSDLDPGAMLINDDDPGCAADTSNSRIDQVGISGGVVRRGVVCCGCCKLGVPSAGGAALRCRGGEGARHALIGAGVWLRGGSALARNVAAQDLQVGVRYLFVVSGFNGAAGRYVLNITCNNCSSSSGGGSRGGKQGRGGGAAMRLGEGWGGAAASAFVARPGGAWAPASWRAE